VFANLRNVTTQDAYSAATTLRLPKTERIVLQVANAAVLYQIDVSLDGKGAWLEERFLAPSIGSLDRRCSGIRFRSAVAGAPAQVSCELMDADELAGGADALSGFGQFVSASGAVGSSLSLLTGDIFWSTSGGAREGALLCDGTLYDAVADPTLENLWSKIGTRFGGTGKSAFAVPDLRGRVAVSTGPNAAVDTIGKSDGVAAGNRRPQHRHTPHEHTIRAPQAGGAFTVALAGNVESTVQSGQMGTADGGSGNPNDALDAPAYLVLAAYIVK
jgi:microcystin-dependent protein